MNRPESDVPPAASSKSAEDILAECLALSESRWSDAIRDACRARPDLAQPLEQLFRNIRAIEGVLRPATAEPDRGAEPAPGSVLGDYDLIERVGGGGMGVVYRARQRSLDRRVALKLIRPEHLYFERSKERFRRETEAVSRLHHPGIVPLFEAGEFGGLPYFTMEFIDGQSVAAILNALRFRDPVRLRAADFLRAYRQGAPAGSEPLDEGVFSSLETRGWTGLCCRIAARVAQALEHAHQNGVVHRDIKPSNLMVTDSGRVVIVDFGLAISDGASSLTSTGTHPGSLPYMSPEQLAGAPIDNRTDLYSLGVTLYEMLTLRCPFPGTNPAAARRQIAAGTFGRPRSRNRAISPEIEAVCLKAMDRDPARRYATAAELSQDLVNAVVRRPIAARTFSPARRLLRLVQRHPARAVATASLFLALVVGPAMLVFQQERHLQAIQAKHAEAETARARAVESEQEARAVSEFLAEMIDDADPASAQSKDLTVRDALIRSADRAGARFGHLPRVHATVLLNLATMLFNLGLRDQARAQSGEATRIVESSLGRDHPLMIAALCRLADDEGDLDRAESYARDAIALAEGGVVADPRMVAEPYGRLAEILYFSGRPAEAEEAARKAIVRAEAALAGSESDPLHAVSWMRKLNDYCMTLGTVLAVRGDGPSARRLVIAQLDRAKAVISPDSPTLLGLLATLNEIDTALGDQAAALGWAQEALRIAEAAFESNNGHRLGARLMVLKSSDADSIESKLEELDKLIDELEQTGRNGSETHLAALAVRAYVAATARHYQAAIDNATEALARIEKVGRARNVRSRQLALSARSTRARAHLLLNQHAEAAIDANVAIDLARAVGAPADVASNSVILASCAWADGRRPDWESILRKAIALVDRPSPPESITLGNLQQVLAAYLWRAGRFEEAESWNDVALDSLLGDSSLAAWRRTEALVDRGDMYLSWGRLKDAVRTYDEARRLARTMPHSAALGLSISKKLVGVRALVDPSGCHREEIEAALPSGVVTEVSAAAKLETSYLLAFARSCDDADAGFDAMREALAQRSRRPEGGDVLFELLACHFARVALARGNHGEAEEWAALALANAANGAESGPWIRELCRVELGRALLAGEEVEGAARVLAEVRVVAGPGAVDAWAIVATELNAAETRLRAQTVSDPAAEAASKH